MPKRSTPSHTHTHTHTYTKRIKKFELFRESDDGWGSEELELGKLKERRDLKISTKENFLDMKPQNRKLNSRNREPEVKCLDLFLAIFPNST